MESPINATYNFGYATVRIHQQRPMEEIQAALKKANTELFRAAEKQIPGYFRHLKDVPADWGRKQ